MMNGNNIYKNYNMKRILENPKDKRALKKAKKQKQKAIEKYKEEKRKRQQLDTVDFKGLFNIKQSNFFRNIPSRYY